MVFSKSFEYVAVFCKKILLPLKNFSTQTDAKVYIGTDSSHLSLFSRLPMASMASAFAASNYIFCQSGLLMMMMRRPCPTAASTERPAASLAGGALGRRPLTVCADLSYVHKATVVTIIQAKLSETEDEEAPF